MSEGQVHVVFMGNAGSGKSTLLEQVGGDFESGVAFREGFTKDVATKDIVLTNGDSVKLVDTPGIFESTRKMSHQTWRNLIQY
jgi:tRNA U34 5-carboxymethylaminomethyl modifying GTPase MnmE/TrmE